MNRHEVPDKPYELERVVSTRIKPETHKALRQVAAQRDCSVAAVFKDALAQYLSQYVGAHRLMVVCSDTLSRSIL